MIKLATLFIVLATISFTGMSQQNKSEVMIIGTIHQAHTANPNYTYDSLFAYIDRFDPDIIGIEIRKEDIDSSFTYLSQNYPFEMIECLRRYPEKKVYGFDWLGHDLEGKGIPSNYWVETSSVKKLQKELSRDTLMHRKLSLLKAIQSEQHRIVLNASLPEFNDGKYDLITFIYYKQMETIFQDTPYAALPDFFQQRDQHIAGNIIDLIQDNKGKRMIFLLGADHRDYTLKKIKEDLGQEIILNP